MARTILIILLIGGVGPLLASATLQRETKWIRLPLPIPQPATGSQAGGGGDEEAAAEAPECMSQDGCPDSAGTCNRMTPPTCPAGTRAKCYWPVPNTPTGCRKLTGVEDCGCANA